MRFTKSGDVYKVIRITGSQDNILGISFSDAKQSHVDLVEWPIKSGAERKSSGDQVLKQVVSGLNSINEELGSDYHLSAIYFLPSDSASNSVYEFLAREIVKNVADGGEFLEV